MESTSPTIRAATAAMSLLYTGIAILWVSGVNLLFGRYIDNPDLLGGLGVINGVLLAVVAGVTAIFLLLGRRRTAAADGGDRPEGLHRKGNRLPLLIIGLAMMVPLFSSFIILQQSPRLQKRAFSDLSAIADLKADQIESWLRERRKDAETLALSPRFTERVKEYLQAGDASAGERITTRLRDLIRTNHYEIDLLDAGGQAIIALGEGYAAPDVRTRRTLTSAFASGEAQFIDLHRGTDRQLRLSYLVPLFDQDPAGERKNLGGLVFHMKVEDFLFPLIQTWPTASPSAETVLVRRDGDDVLFLNKLRHRDGVELNQRYPLSTPHLPAAEAVITNKKQVMTGLDYRRIPVMAAVRPVQGTPWFLVAKMDRSEIMAPLRELVTWCNVIVFFAIVSITATVTRLWRQKSRAQELELRSQMAEKERVLRHFYDLSLIGMQISSPQTLQTLHVNNELCKITGYTREELLGFTWIELIHPDHRSADLGEFERLLSGALFTCTRDTRLIRRDRTVIDISINAQCVRDPAGKAELVIATVQDVTARKAIEDAMRESEANLNHAQQIARIGSWALDVRRNILTWSDESYRIFGISPGTPLNYETFLECVHPDDRDYVDRQWNAAIRGAAYDVEHRIVVDGKIKWIRERAILNFAPSGRLIGGIGTAQDITERKEIELKLRASEDIRRESQRIARLGHYALDIGTGSWTSSGVLDDIFGISADYPRTVGSWLDLVHPEQREEMLHYLQNHVLRDCKPFDREYRIVRHSDGKTRWVHGLGRLHQGKDGNPERMVGTIQDVTTRIEIESALRENESRLHQAIRASAIGIFDHDHLSDTIYWSPEQCAIYDWETDRPVTLDDFIAGIHPEDREAIARAVVRAHDPAGDGLFDVEHRIVRQDGEVRWTMTKSQTVFEQQGDARRPLRTVGAVLDITERKQAEITLRENKLRYKAMEERFRAIYENTHDGILLSDTENASLLMGNPAACRMLGYDESELTRLNVADIVRPADLAATMEEFGRYKQREASISLNWPFLHKDGTVVYADVRSTPIQVAGKTYLMGVLHDVTERRRNEERLRLTSAVFENSQEGVLVTDVDQRIVLVNRALCELKGYSEVELLGQQVDMLQSGRHDEGFYAAMWETIRTSGHWHGEVWNRHRNGTLIPVLMSISTLRDNTGAVTHYVSITTDITLQKSSEARLEYMAHHDSLTQLPNRLLIHSRIEHGIEVARREDRRLALLMLDLDQFKDVNDSFGHLAGDELLQQVSSRLTTRLRGVDTVARLGGDEFAVLLDNPAHQEDALRIANEIIVLLSEPWHLSNGAEVRVGVSVGISLFPEHGQGADVLFQQADAALYRAKAEGRGCARFFSDDLTQAARHRLEIESKLRRALKQGELRVHYQPQVDMASGRIIGAEALLRWQDPERGMIPPGVFIPVAEETGLISEIGAWVLQETCRQGRQWIELGLPPLTLSVNLSPHQFRFSDIWSMVKDALAASNFPPERLELELTESALMTREGETAEIIDRLRAQGVRLAIDDFGTGYSSLAYLKHFSIDVLKIDKRFVDDISHNQDDRAITAAIIAMAHTLGFEVTAEGVETAEQLAYLRSQGCDRYQGYLVSPAVPAADFAALLSGRQQDNRAG